VAPSYATSSYVNRITRQPAATSAASLRRSRLNAERVRWVSQPSVSTTRRYVGQ
jgi:hypothetical protein